jgi:hypothetical protein
MTSSQGSDRRMRFGPAPWTTDFERLERSGAALPPPPLLDDEEVAAKLWEVIGRLAGMGIFLEHTDHLSDRDLYEALWSDVLRDETKPAEASDEPDGCWVIDLVGRNTEDEVRLWLRHYAAEDERASWLAAVPLDGDLEPCEPLFDRDRHLPAPLCVLEERGEPAAA